MLSCPHLPPYVLVPRRRLQNVHCSVGTSVKTSSTSSSIIWSVPSDVQLRFIVLSDNEHCRTFPSQYYLSIVSTVSLVSVSHMCSGMYLRTFTCLFHSVFPILFLSCAVSSRYCSTPLQESQRMQTKLDALTREVFDLQETINWKDKKIGVGGLKLVLRQSVERQRCWTFLPFNNSFASHTVSA